MSELQELHIDLEAVATLAMAKEGLLYPVTKLMGQKEALEVDRTQMYRYKSFPFSFVLAPSGKKNEQTILNLKTGETVKLMCQGEEIGKLKMSEVFPINKDERIRLIYGTNNQENQGVRDTYRRLGNYAISGEYSINFPDIAEHIAQVRHAAQDVEARTITSIMLSGKPFHRVHERIIRNALAHSDLMVIFLMKSYTNDFLPFELRYKTIQYFIDNFLPKNRVVLVPLENTYIFGGINELILDAVVAKNFGCHKLIIGQNHAGLGAYYDKDALHSILDTLVGIDIEVEVMSEFVYCDKCKTLVGTTACPHGRHHHVNYHSDSILDLLKMGFIPPTILMRKEISAMILSHIFKDKTAELETIYQNIFPLSGLLEEFKDEDFYKSLIGLYQTTSLT